MVARKNKTYKNGDDREMDPILLVKTKLVMEENERRERILAEANDTRQVSLSASKYSVASDRDDCQPSPGSVMTILHTMEKRNNNVANNHTAAVVGAGDYVDASNAPTLPMQKTKLKSFQESRFPYYAASVYSKVSSASVGTSTEDDRFLFRPSANKPRKANDGTNEGPDDVELANFDVGWKPPREDFLEGLPTRDDLPLSVGVAIDNDSADGAKSGGSDRDFPKEKDGMFQLSGGTNNNKEAERDEEKSCLVDCLYYTLQCCDCSIM